MNVRDLVPNDLTDQSFVDWKRLADSAPAMLWCIDQHGAPLYYNRQWIRFAGIRGTDDLANAWQDRLHPDDIDWVMRSSGESLKNRQSIRLEYRLLRYDGDYRHVLDMGEPQFDQTGEFIGYIGTTIDITEQRQDAIALRKSHEDLNRTATEIQLLNELNDNLQVCKNILETRLILKRFGSRLFRDHSVSICLFSESRNSVEPFVSWGEATPLPKVFAPDQCWALRRGKLHTEIRCDDGTICPNHVSCAQFGYMCVPMMAYGEVVGTFNLAFNEPQADEAAISWSESSRTKRLAQICADQIALAIANLKLRETLHYQSTRDTLTQLYNRRYLLDNLEREFCRAKQTSSPLSLMMIDVDHFKRYNDTNGHDAGDLILRELGSVLSDSVRDSDIVCRYGGEEFVVAMPDIPKETAEKVADRIRRRVEEITIVLREVPLGKISISVGVAEFPGDAETIETLLTCSDQALYSAKGSGRNRIVLYSQLGETKQSLPQVVADPVQSGIS